MNLKINLQLINRDTFIVTLPRTLSHDSKPIALIQELIQQKFKGKWNHLIRKWEISRSFMRQFIHHTKKLGYQMKIEDIPEQVNNILSPIRDELIVYQGSNIVATLKYNPDHRKKTYQLFPREYNHMLYPYQQRCIDFCLRFHGRALIADQIGLGKTVEALSVAFLLRQSWQNNPLVILCSNCLRLCWKEEILKWYQKIGNWSLKPKDIRIIHRYNQRIDSSNKILLISYEMAIRYLQMLRILNPAFVICDEAHILQNNNMKNVGTLIPFLKSRKHIILLSSTPKFSKPKDLLVFLNILRPDIYKQSKAFINRYCDQKANKIKEANYQGIKNIKQLYFLFHESIMIRRLKKDVLFDLPNKIRQRIDILVEKDIAQQVTRKIQGQGPGFMSNFVEKLIENKVSEKDNKIWSVFNDCYKLSGEAKIKSVFDYLNILLLNNIKVIIYAHHISILDQIQQFTQKSKHQYIRIDGSTPYSKKEDFINDFQKNRLIRIGILSLTCNNLQRKISGVQHLVFIQLHWNPEILIKAQNMLNTDTSIHCHYLIGKNTMDSIIYNKINGKLNNKIQKDEILKNPKGNNQQSIKNNHSQKENDGGNKNEKSEVFFSDSLNFEKNDQNVLNKNQPIVIQQNTTIYFNQEWLHNQLSQQYKIDLECLNVNDQIFDADEYFDQIELKRFQENLELKRNRVTIIIGDQQEQSQLQRYPRKLMKINPVSQKTYNDKSNLFKNRLKEPEIKILRTWLEVSLHIGDTYTKQNY